MLCDPGQYIKIGLLVLYYCFQGFRYDYDPLIFSDFVVLKMYIFFPPSQESETQDLLLLCITGIILKCNSLFGNKGCTYYSFDVFWKTMDYFRNAVKKESLNSYPCVG